MLSSFLSHCQLLFHCSKKAHIRAHDALTEDPLVVDVLDAIPDPHGKDGSEDVQVEEEGKPSRRLVLRDGGDDGDMYLGVAGVPKRVEAPAPGGDDAGVGEPDDHDEHGHGGDERAKQDEVTKLGLGHVSLEELEQRNRVHQREDAWK